MITLAAVALVASALSGQPTQVVTYRPWPCETAALACADPANRAIFVRYWLARDLRETFTLSASRAARAILVLAHEARHIAGEMDEHRAGAWAFAHFTQAAHALGRATDRRLLAAARTWAARLYGVGYVQ